MKHQFLIIFLIPLVIVLAISNIARAQDTNDLEPIQFDVAVTPDTATIGDDITVTVTAKHAATLELTEPKVTSADNAVVIKSGPEQKSKTVGDSLIDTYTITAAAFKTGDIELPHFEFFYYDSSGNQNSRMPPIASVIIKSVLPADASADSLQLRDIVGPIFLSTLWWPYAVGGLAVILIALGFWYFLKRKAQAVSIPQAPLEPPFDAAIRKLNELAKKELPEKGKYKLYYIELSEILRYYIEGRFEIKAIESTTFELKRILKHPDLAGDHIKDALDFLNHADMIKFARHTPSPEMPGKDFDLVKKFVVETKPKPLPVAQPEVAA